MAKRRKNRFSGIQISDEMKKQCFVCSYCKKYILGTIISAPSLGNGIFHDKCAKLLWRKIKDEENEKYEKKQLKKSKKNIENNE